MNIINKTFMTHSGTKFRVLWAEEDNVHIIDIDMPRMPFVVSAVDLVKGSIPIKDPYELTDINVPRKYIQMRDRTWSIMGQLLTAEPDVYCSKKRAVLIHSLPELRGFANKFIYNSMKKYWVRGKNINAFVPDYANCGRNSNVGKTGRKRADGSSAPVITPELYKVLLRTFEGLQAKQYKSIKEAYRNALALVTVDGQNEIISYGQFRRVYRKFIGKVDFFGKANPKSLVELIAEQIDS